ncbi:VOC family protein [Pedobacter steynii]
MAILNSYLNFDGDAEAAFNFYKSVFGGEFLALTRFKEIPECELMSPEDQEKIMHISLPIGDLSVLMATDILRSLGQTLNPGNNSYISISADTEEEALRLFNGLSTDGVVTIPLEKSFWGSFFGMFTDKFGIQWMINYDFK